jgi:hypothetical protein
MVSPLATCLDVKNNAGGRNSRQLSTLPVVCRAALRASLAKKFGVTHPWREAATAGIESPISKGANVLLSLLCLIFDQPFRHSWPLAACRFEFLAARIVVRNKEVLDFAY